MVCLQSVLTLGVHCHATKNLAQKTRFHSANAELFREQLDTKGRAPGTIEHYLNQVAILAEHYRQPPDQLTEDQVRKYILLRKQNLKLNSMRPVVAAIKFFFAQTVPRDWPTLREVRIPTVRTLPYVLLPDKVWQLIDATRAFHWQVFFRTSYTCGLRSGDTRQLTVHDIEADRQQLHIRKTKNLHERLVPLPDATLQALRSYWSTHRHPKWLFPSNVNKKQMHLAEQPVSTAGAAKAFGKVAQSLGWKHPGLRPHTLRHSYATTMLDAGVNIKVLQTYLGHQNLKSTEIYLHLTRYGDEKARRIVQHCMNGPISDLTNLFPSERDSGADS